MVFMLFHTQIAIKLVIQYMYVVVSLGMYSMYVKQY